MKFKILLLLALFLTGSLASAFDLSEGKPFPRLTLPPIEGGEAVSVETLMGEKLMLHLFASW